MHRIVSHTLAALSAVFLTTVTVSAILTAPTTGTLTIAPPLA